MRFPLLRGRFLMCGSALNHLSVMPSPSVGAGVGDHPISIAPLVIADAAEFIRRRSLFGRHRPYSFARLCSLVPAKEARCNGCFMTAVPTCADGAIATTSSKSRPLAVNCARLSIGLFRRLRMLFRLVLVITSTICFAAGTFLVTLFMVFVVLLF